MSEKMKLQEVLDRLNNRLTYHNLDIRALDISRASDAGNMGEGNYAEWAMVSDDPLVAVNIVKTYITTQCAKLTGSPFRPVDDKLSDMGEKMRLNAALAEIYRDVLVDGYAYGGVGVAGGKPFIKQIDARYILFNGTDPTLKDATELVVFEILPKTDKDKENESPSLTQFPEGFVEFDEEEEKIITTYYHIETVEDQDSITGTAVSRKTCEIDTYEDYENEPSSITLNIDRIPVIRFVGGKVELEDKRFHYRGLYYETASVLKATILAATKIQIRTAAADDDNYIVSRDAIDNENKTWDNCGIKTVDDMDANGQPIKNPVTPIVHDNAFLINAFQTWVKVIGDMLGPVVASGSEAVTREEVIARNEVRDAITNEYLSKFVNSVEEVYRCVVMLLNGPTDEIEIVGGFIDAVKRNKTNGEIMQLYGLAKESGLNTQGFVMLLLQNSEIPTAMKQQLQQSLMRDPYASPLVQQLKTQIQQLAEQSKAKDQTISLLRIQATQRLERQAEYVAMQERVEQQKTLFDQWKVEQEQSQDARMEVLKDCLTKNDIPGAMAVLATIQQTDKPLVIPETPQTQATEYKQAVQKEIGDSMSPVAAANREIQQQNQQRFQHRMAAAAQTAANGRNISPKFNNPAISHNVTGTPMTGGR